MNLPRSHPLRVLHGLMLAETLGDVHDEVKHLHEHYGLPEPEGDFLEGFTPTDFGYVETAIEEEVS